MSGEIDRDAYCEQVGIHPSTLSRWIRENVVTPDWSSGAQTFTEQNVRFGRALILMLRRHPGQYTLREMVEIVRGEREQEPFTRGPPGSGARTSS